MEVCLMLVFGSFAMLGVTSVEVMQRINVSTNVCFITEGGKKLLTPDLGIIYKRHIKELAIDLTSMHFVEHVDVKYAPTNSGGSKRIITKYADLKGPVSKECRKISNSVRYLCQSVARVLSFVDIRSQIESIEIYGYDTKLSKYVGCYEDKNFADLETEVLDSLQDCESKCIAALFYAMNSVGQCICVENLPRVTPDRLNLCNETCPNRSYQLCGSSNYYSIYAKRNIHKVPPIRCLMTFVECPACDDRVGAICEVIKCDIENGSCGGMVCQGSNNTAHESYEVCHCTQGYQMTDNLICQDIDECHFDDPCEASNETCVNNDGNYTCQCHDGFHRMDGRNCEDVNECNVTETCDHVTTTCVNLYGSYQCVCNEGYTRKEGRTPRDKCVDEPRRSGVLYLILCILLAFFFFALATSAYFLYVVPARIPHELIP